MQMGRKKSHGENFRFETSQVQVALIKSLSCGELLE